MFYVSGEIPRVTPFERGMPGQERKTEDGSGWYAVGRLLA
jgi:7,8-dihydropterin-6-yl-methyl-4-(beta-D-ribofuranosyl)aminobenzene 5'-phosphate synthase